MTKISQISKEMFKIITNMFEISLISIGMLNMCRYRNAHDFNRIDEISTEILETFTEITYFDQNVHYFD